MNGIEITFTGGIWGGPTLLNLRLRGKGKEKKKTKKKKKTERVWKTWLGNSNLTPGNRVVVPLQEESSPIEKLRGGKDLNWKRRWAETRLRGGGYLLVIRDCGERAEPEGRRVCV